MSSCLPVGFAGRQFEGDAATLTHLRLHDLSVAPSGRSFWEANPGLKPWAVLFSHFVAIEHTCIAVFAHSP